MRWPRLNTREIVPRGAGGLLLLLVVPTVIAVVALAILLGSQLEDKLRQDALDSAERSGQVFASLMFDADEFENGRLKGADTFGDLRQAIRADNTVMAVRLYSAPDRVIFATDRALRGEADAVDEVTRAFAGETTSEVTTLGQEQSRSEDTTPASGAKVLEVNLPIRAPGRRRPTLVAAVFLPYGDTNAAIASQIARTRLLIAGVALLLVAIVIPLFIRGARSMAGGRRHTRFQREMRDALKRDELVLHYQPKVDLRSGAVVGTEALVRWQHPEHGLLAPDRFIPQAEETGLIEPLTMRVFELALAQVARWRAEGTDLPPVAVNFSPATLGDTELAGKLAVLLERHEVAARDVVIEMTESSMAANADVSHGVLAALDHLGLTALDRRLRDRLLVAGAAGPAAADRDEDRPLVRHRGSPRAGRSGWS